MTHSVPNFDLDSITLCRATWGGHGRLADRSSSPAWPSRSSRCSSRAGFRTALVYSLYGPVAAEIFRIITERTVFRRPGLEGRHGSRPGMVGADLDHDGVAAVGWSPSRRPEWRRSTSVSWWKWQVEKVPAWPLLSGTRRSPLCARIGADVVSRCERGAPEGASPQRIVAGTRSGPINALAPCRRPPAPGFVSRRSAGSCYPKSEAPSRSERSGR